jgi:hypothetical protein
LWRDTEGRGALLSGALDGPQVVAILFVLAGAFVLLERKRPAEKLESKDLKTETQSSVQSEGNEAEHG